MALHPFCPQSRLASASPGLCSSLPWYLLHHKLWVPCIMSSHQDQECLLGLLPSHRDGLLTHSQWVSHGVYGAPGWVLPPWASVLPGLESWFLLELSEDWRLVSECAIIFQDKGTLAAKLGSHLGASRLRSRAGSPCPGILLGCEIQPLWHGLVGHDVLPAIEASSLPKWPSWLGYLLLSAPEYSMPRGGKVQGPGPQEEGGESLESRRGPRPCHLGSGSHGYCQGILDHFPDLKM